MENQKIKILLTVSICTFFLFLALGSGSTSEDSNAKVEVKTNFSNCDELARYVNGLSYPALVEQWGNGSIGEPWNSSAGVGEIKVKVVVTWNNVECNGKSVKIDFDCDEDFSKSPHGTPIPICD